jgi:hypothetical protein
MQRGERSPERAKPETPPSKENLPGGSEISLVGEDQNPPVRDPSVDSTTDVYIVFSGVRKPTSFSASAELVSFSVLPMPCK